MLSVLQELEDHGNGNKAFLIGASFILEVCSRATDIFDSPHSSVEQKRYLLDFVFQNMVLEDKRLILPLKQLFGAIAEMSKNKDWCRV